MNEPAALEPPAPEAGSAPAQRPGFGSALGQARLRAGLSVEQAAARLRLQPRQLQALEREDFDRLPGPAYVTGFIRNYGRELNIDTSALIEDLNAKLQLKGLSHGPLTLGPGGGEVRMQRLDDRGWRQLVLAGIVLALLCAGLIGTWMAHPGMRAGERAGATPAASAVAPSEPAPLPRGTGAADGQTAGPSEATPQSAAQQGPAGGSPAPSTAAPDSGASEAPRPPASAPGASAGKPSAAPAPASPSSAAPAATGGPLTGLVLRFNERSWFEVSRPNGQVLLSRNGEAGSMELLNIAAPLRLVVGRAEAVQVEYRGRAVDLKPYANSNGVARLMLADGRVISGGQNDHERP